MSCYHPLSAYRIQLGPENTKIVFLKSGASIPTNGEYLRLPCGQCIGCRLDKSREWATRCMHEARQHKENCFITLTYADEYLPADQSLDLTHWQKFMKRLRKHAGSRKLKFFHAGEYGEELKRPHYHACIFGYDFPDKELWKVRDNIPLYNSATLDALWGAGFTSIGDVTWDSAAYVARYCVKKLNGALANKPDPKTGLLPYERIDLYSPTVHTVAKEYATMSRRPGLGSDHVYEFLDDIYPADECIVNGHPTRPPRYYDNIYERDYPESMEEIRQRRTDSMREHEKDNTRARLSQRETVKLAQSNQLKRELK